MPSMSPSRPRIHKRPQPERLPNNIYGTDGDWETYSTPSRDARLKTAFKELRDEVARFLALAAAGSDRLAYAGEDIRRDIREVYLQETSACSIAYARSDGSEKQLGFAEVARRLFALSFDPHHCAERRWGAQDAEELATCPDGADKRAWYDAERRLRNQPDRTYDVRMGFSLADLRKGVPGSGIDAPPGIDVLALLGDADGTGGRERPQSRPISPRPDPANWQRPETRARSSLNGRCTSRGRCGRRALRRRAGSGSSTAWRRTPHSGRGSDRPSS